MRSWGFLLSLLVTSFAWAIYSFTLMMVYTNPPWAKASIGAVAGLLLGALAGAGQYALLLERISHPARWVVLTALGWSCAAVLVALVSATRISGDRSIEYALGLALGGIAVGLLQWMALKRRSTRFIPSTATIWASAGFLSWKLYEGLFSWLYLSGSTEFRPGLGDAGFVSEVVAGLIGAAVSGLLLGVITSYLLLFPGPKAGVNEPVSTQ